MKLRVISVGPRHDKLLTAKRQEFEKRLPYSIAWQLLPYSKTDGQSARRLESHQIASKLSPQDLVVLLDETGVQLTSEGLAAKFADWQSFGRPLVFVIGGAYGVDSDLKARADFVWSLSKLVFPHQLVRLMLVEQLYRAATINQGHPYHHS